MTDNCLGTAIIGCGLIGRKRAAAMGSRARLVVCADKEFQRAEALSQVFPDVEAVHNWQDAVTHQEVDAVIVATTNDVLVEISRAAVAAGKHILVEKPGARNCRELDELIREVESSSSLARIGFNHRYHPAFQKAHLLVQAEDLGQLMFIRARYGHGGRLGYESEWRAQPHISGGGELLDQGVHLIDLARWFMGDFKIISGSIKTYFWNAPVEDNAFLTLETPAGQTAFLQASCTEWKNLFSFEIYFQKAKLHIEGLGGSYGLERLCYYKMLPQMGPPETTIWEFPGADSSWLCEMNEFIEDIRLQRMPSVNLYDARAALKVVDIIYKEAGNDHYT